MEFSQYHLVLGRLHYLTGVCWKNKLVFFFCLTNFLNIFLKIQLSIFFFFLKRYNNLVLMNGRNSRINEKREACQKKLLVTAAASPQHLHFSTLPLYFKQSLPNQKSVYLKHVHFFNLPTHGAELALLNPIYLWR